VRITQFRIGSCFDEATITGAWCSRYGWLVGLAWGLAESTVFFIVPDVGVAFVAAMSPRNWWLLAQSATQLLVRIPGIHPATLALASTRIADHGAGALLLDRRPGDSLQGVRDRTDAGWCQPSEPGALGRHLRPLLGRPVRLVLDAMTHTVRL
jgi:hypothetical protein